MATLISLMVLFTVAWGSYFLLGRDTTIDDSIEDVMEEVAEDALNAQDGELEGTFESIMPPDLRK